MATVGIVIRPGVEAAVALARSAIESLIAKGHEVILEEGSARNIGSDLKSVTGEVLAVTADPIITLGGDGTLIGIGRHVKNSSPIIIGVNFGNLGFLTEISPNELLTTLDSVLAGKADLAHRDMILSEVFRDGECVFSSQAVNDAVVQKGARDRLLDVDLAVDDEPVMRIRADGLIVATSTGSTAYSLAAGGSIAHPSLSVVLVTPICAHLLTVRPLILRLDQVLKIKIPLYDGLVFLCVDGQDSCALVEGDEIRITKAPNKVTFVRSTSRSYFEILRAKLNWGIGNKAE